MSKPKLGPQDLPPPGGYAPFQIQRIKLRDFGKGRIALAAFCVANLIGFPLYRDNWRKVREAWLERKSAELALFPMVLAEQDRTVLKYMKRARELESDVMKDFPFWKTGTLFGVPIYETLPEDTYIEPIPMECSIFSDPLKPPITHYAYMLDLP